MAPWAAVLIGLTAGVLVVWSCLFFERVARVDDPVGAIGVHGVNGAWGVLALGLFADGTYGQEWNGSFWYKIGDKLQWFPEKIDLARTSPEKLQEYGLTDVKPENIVAQGVTGLFYGNASQFYAEAVGVAANLVWVFVSAYAIFWVIDKLIGMRVRPEVELQGLDVPELGVMGYINEDPKVPEGHVAHPSAEPRHAEVPPDGQKRFTVVVEGVAQDQLTRVWSGLCQPGQQPPPPDFLAIYPQMTTVKGNRFRFRGGDPEATRQRLERLLRSYANGSPLRVSVEP